MSQFLASLIVPPADCAASLKAEQDRLLLGISNSDSGTHIKLINTVQHPERSCYLNFFIKFALHAYNLSSVEIWLPALIPREILDGDNCEDTDLSMPGKVLYLGLRRRCIKPWCITLFVQLEGQVFYSIVETKMLIAVINVE